MNHADEPWRQFLCRACGLIYDEEKGDPDSGLAPGTRFDDIPDDWVCPLCGVIKADFEPYEPVAPGSVSTCAVVALPRTGQCGVVVVGAGSAGWGVVEALRALDRCVPIMLISACDADRYHKPELSIALSRGIEPAALVRESAGQAARRLGVALLTETFVTGISPVLKQLRTTRGTLHYEHLVLAQGARAQVPDPLPAELCWRINDLAGWTGLYRRLKEGVRHVAVVGAGMVGCELAEDLVRAGHAVTLISTHEQPLAGLLPPRAGARLRNGLAALGVNYLGPTQIHRLSASGKGARSIETFDGRMLEADEVVVAAGLQTDPRLARSAGLAFERGIVVDPATLRTSADGIYALGDCISLNGSPCRFIEPIARQASVIAHSILGRKYEPYTHRAPVIRLKTRVLPIVVHGMPDVNGHWQVLEETGDYLCMQQWFDGQPVARLEIGKAVQQLAA